MPYASGFFNSFVFLSNNRDMTCVQFQSMKSIAFGKTRRIVSGCMAQSTKFTVQIILSDVVVAALFCRPHCGLALVAVFI